MVSTSDIRLHEACFSLNHEHLADIWTTTENILIIQDLDGVCMGLVKDPLTRVINPNYVKATQALDGHFYVLTNGEHIGKRGVNGIVERAFGNGNEVRKKGWYLPGLAAGGVQWQDRKGNVSHPGVSEAELAFLKAVPAKIEAKLREFLIQNSGILEEKEAEDAIAASVLDNVASPTANLNTFYEKIGDNTSLYTALQQAMHQLMQDLLQEATEKGLSDSFFVHYAPNLGRDEQGKEILWPATETNSGTTDFQFMLRGAIKEAGVLALLNRYYYQRTGEYPLGKDFSVRKAPHSHSELLALVKNNFDPNYMPLMVGVGDTVTSQGTEKEGKLEFRRGGSDRNFLQLIQDIGKELNQGNIIVYIDSSQGEVKNRRQIKLGEIEGKIQVLEGPCDPRDTKDPLTLNVVFPEGYQQYCAFFQNVSQNRKKHN